MALCINWIFGFLFVLMSHPLHMSITNIEYSESGQKWEISIKLFKDDFSNELIRLYGIDPGLEDEKNDLNGKLLFDKYISDHFMLEINEKKIGVEKWKFVERKVNSEAVWLNYSFSFEDQPKDIRIKNTLMFSMFQDQKNLLIFTFKDQQKAYQFRNNKQEVQFKLD